METLLEVATCVVILATLVLGWISITSRERARPDGKWLPRFSLAMLLYLVTAVAVFLRVDFATAGTPLNNPAGGLTMWSLICGGVALHLWRRNTHGQKT